MTQTGEREPGTDAARPTRVLLVGPMAPPIGGATRVFGYLVEDLSQDQRISIQVVNTSRGREGGAPLENVLKAIETLGRTAVMGARSDVVSFHANERARIYFGPLMYTLCKLIGKPLIMRAFGGTFDKKVEALGPLLRWLVKRTYLRADCCLFETKRLAEEFRRVSGCTSVWFPNSTRVTEAPQPEDTVARGCRRLVFLGRLLEAKGVGVILEAAKALAGEVEIDIFGPATADYSEARIRSRCSGAARYRGVLDAGDVPTVLRDYDALLCPTYCETEGYPGVILEAYAAGLPVIATAWLSMAEIVDETSGILIAPRDPDALVGAIRRLCRDPELHLRLRRGARRKAIAFSTTERAEQFIQICESLASGSGLSSSRGRPREGA